MLLSDHDFASHGKTPMHLGRDFQIMKLSCYLVEEKEKLKANQLQGMATSREQGLARKKKAPSCSKCGQPTKGHPKSSVWAKIL